MSFMPRSVQAITPPASHNVTVFNDELVAIDMDIGKTTCQVLNINPMRRRRTTREEAGFS